MDIHLARSKSGIEVAKTIRKTSDVPIIYLTAYSDDETIQQAIQTNPIAYLAKPFKREDLKSTILLSIYKISNKHNIVTTMKTLGYGYLYDMKKKNLFFKEQLIKLTPKEKILLGTLIDANGKPVSFNLLEEYIWRGNFISESARRTLLYRLHIKLEYKLIETIPSFGYRLIPLDEQNDI